MTESAVSSRPLYQRRRVITVVSAVAGVLLVAAVLVAVLLPRGAVARGAVRLSDAQSQALPDGLCIPAGAYEDLGAGATVTVRDDRGRIVATALLGAGRTVGGVCVLPFDAGRVPGDSRWYTVMVGDRDVRGVRFPPGQLGDMRIVPAS